MNTSDPPPAPPPTSRFTVGMLVLLAIVLSVLATLWVARVWLYPQPFQPVVLDTRERAALDSKLESLSADAPEPTTAPQAPDAATDVAAPPEAAPYSERPEDRVIHFSQRELNAMIARNPDLAERLALHLSDDMISARMLVTLPPDFPVFASQTLRISTGLSMRYENGRPVVIVQGVSLMGVPLPSAWLGGIKGHDLMALHGAEGGFWQAFGEGVRDLTIEDGRLRVELAQ